jgi:hypothetical protein
MTDKRYANLWIIDFDGSGHRPLASRYVVEVAGKDRI